MGGKIDVKIGVHQGSVLSPLFFVIVLEALSREFRSTLSWEMFDDLVIIDESLEEFDTWYAVWKHCMKGEGLSVNLAKTKVMISDVNVYPTFTLGKHPCGVCCNGFSSNSIFCNNCAHWMCEHCSGLTGRLDNVVNFKCITSLNPTVADDDDKKARLGNVEYEVVDQFCYHGDILISISRIRSIWKEFREFLPFVTSQISSIFA